MTAVKATLAEQLRAVLERAGSQFNTDDQIAPAAVLWTDGERQWEQLVATWHEDMPHLLTLGEYDPDARTGPAIALKVFLAGAMLEVYTPSESVVPILYLPGVHRRDLRAVEDCPQELQPLAELQFRGVCFNQRGGTDWTITAFLVNDELGLGLDVASDKATKAALKAGLLRLANQPTAQLHGKRIKASDLQDLAHGDPAESLLRWIDDPHAMAKAWDGNDWQLFVDLCKQSYGFDPVAADGPLEAARRLGKAEGPWAQVWARFASQPHRYKVIPDKLRQAKPSEQSLFADEH
jgi:hypothetical protein